MESQSRNAQTQVGNWRVCIALLIVAAGLFWPALNFDFVNYDDPVFVTQNAMVQSGLSLQNIASAFTSLHIYWQPLTWISYMIDHDLGGHGGAGIYRATNLILHLASTVLLFLALKGMTQSHWPSAMVAALFAIHPLHIETAVWISERKGVLCGFFWHLALLAYVRHAVRPRAWTALLVTCAFALSLMSKSLGVTLPCVLLLLDFWPLKRVSGSRSASSEAGGTALFAPRSIGQLILEKLPLFALAAASSFVTVEAQKRMGAVLGTEMFSMKDRLVMAMTSLAGYLRKMLSPNDLAVFYPNPGEWPAAQIAVSALVLLALTGVGVWQWKRRPYLIVGWLWFAGMLLPVSGLLQTGEQLMADRYTYLALTGALIASVWGVAELFESRGMPRAVQAALAGLVLALTAVFSKGQIATWKNTRTLFEQAHAVTRGNYLADTVLGTLMTAEGRHEEALRHFESALKIQPRYAETHFRMGLTLAAMTNFSAATERFKQALQADPSNVDVLAALASSQKSQGSHAAAIETYERLLQLRPASNVLRHELATLLHRQGRYDRAVPLYRDLLKANPDQPEILNNLSWILATHPDANLRNGAEAVQWAERACKIAPGKFAVLIGTLAAAYAEAGRFEDAVKAAEEAQRVAEAAGETAVAKRNAELRESYLARRPWRESAP